MFIVCSVATALADPLRLALVPFQIHSEKDLAFIKESITDMLSSRLHWENRVAIIGRDRISAFANQAAGPWTEETARRLGERLRADFVIFGSLTVVGNRISIDSKMVDVSGDHPALIFSAVVQKMGRAMARINRFATEINQTVFDRAPPPSLP